MNSGRTSVNTLTPNRNGDNGALPLDPQITFTRPSSGHPLIRAPHQQGIPSPPNHTCAVMHISQSIATKRSSLLHPPLGLPCWPRKDPSSTPPLPLALARDATGVASALAAHDPGAPSAGASLTSIICRFCGGCSSVSMLSSPFFSPEAERPSLKLQLGSSPSAGSTRGGGGGGGAPL